MLVPALNDRFVFVDISQFVAAVFREVDTVIVLDPRVSDRVFEFALAKDQHVMFLLFVSNVPEVRTTVYAVFAPLSIKCAPRLKDHPKISIVNPPPNDGLDTGVNVYAPLPSNVNGYGQDWLAVEFISNHPKIEHPHTAF